MKKLILLYLFCLCVGFSSLSEAGKALTIIPTTKQAVIFTFGGLQNAQTVADVLQRMDEEKLRGTFFVTERELRENQGTIRLIKNHGQEIGIGLRPGDAPTRDAVKGQLGAHKDASSKRIWRDTDRGAANVWPFLNHC